MMKTMMTAALIAAPMTIAAAQTTSAPTYVMKAGASDLYEKQSSQLVLASTAKPELKSFAQMMITDHTKSTADVKAAATRSGVTPKPPVLEPTQARNIAALRAAKGTARDTLYVSQQKTSHQQALALHQGYAANGSAKPLKAVASNIVPVVQHHIEMLDAM